MAFGEEGLTSAKMICKMLSIVIKPPKTNGTPVSLA
jgi:hypothetical protein